MLDFKPEKRKIDLIDSERRSKRRNDQEKLVASETRSKRQNDKQTEVKEQKKGNNYFSKRLLVKRKPLFFVEAISKLNEAQINSVKEMGFESVLDFKIDSIPSILAFSLLKSFDEQECKINLNNGKSITITEEDVELVYGFPRGDINLCREKWKRNARFMGELAEECDSKPGNVKHKAVQQLMLADHEGGPQFKRLFLVLLESALIEPSTCGMIKSKLGDVIDDLDSVRNINWCSYTISVLKFAMKNWSKTEKNAFAGPLPFLMAREDKEISEGVFGLGRIKKRYILEEKEQQGEREENKEEEEHEEEEHKEEEEHEEEHEEEEHEEEEEQEEHVPQPQITADSGLGLPIIYQSQKNS